MKILLDFGINDGNKTGVEQNIISEQKLMLLRNAPVNHKMKYQQKQKQQGLYMNFTSQPHLVSCISLTAGPFLIEVQHNDSN